MYSSALNMEAAMPSQALHFPLDFSAYKKKNICMFALLFVLPTF
jgi:hypothetical protein